MSFLAHCSLAYSHLACLGMGMYGSASFLGAKKCGIVGPEEPMFFLLRGATQVSPEWGIYDFLAGAAVVTL